MATLQQRARQGPSAMPYCHGYSEQGSKQASKGQKPIRGMQGTPGRSLCQCKPSTEYGVAKRALSGLLCND